MNTATFLAIFCLVPGSLLGVALALCTAAVLARAGLAVAAECRGA